MSNPRLGVSTWSLNKSLTAGTPLLDIPAQVAAHGLSKLEVCHFHFPSVEESYLAEFRAAVQSAGIEFYALLIDEGDLTHPDHEQREEVLDMMTYWAGVASKCGAKRIRVIAGDAAPSEKTLKLSASGLEPLFHRAHDQDLQVVTENWHLLLDDPQSVLRLLEMMHDRIGLHGHIGLKLDFGNWQGERKYDDMAKIAPLADCTHAKAAYLPSGEMDHADFLRCLDICRDAGFSGPHILIFSDAGDEWDNLDKMRDVVLPYVSDRA